MNPDTSIAKTWYKYLRDIHSQERLFYAVMAYRYYYLDDDRIGLHDIDDYFTEDEFDRLRGAYKRERLDLQTEEVIEYVGEDGMYTKDYFRIKDEIKDEMLADLGGIKKDEKRVDSLLRGSSLPMPSVLRSSSTIRPKGGRLHS